MSMYRRLTALCLCLLLLAGALSVQAEEASAAAGACPAAAAPDADDSNARRGTPLRAFLTVGPGLYNRMVHMIR